MKTALSQFNNSWYKPGSKIKIATWFIISGIVFKNSLFPFSGIKIILLRLFGAKIGKGVVIKTDVNIKYPWLLKIGNYCWIGEKVWIDNLALVSISDNVCISQGALLICGNHHYKKVGFDLMIKPIILEEGVWLAAGSMVSGGVVCASHSVLSFGSVATKSLEPYSIYSGNPCVKIKTREINL
jgi:putative colanic acid biosynthesis acetyltransferase WcaF